MLKLAVLLNPRVVIVYELHVGEGKVSHLAVEFPFPLSVDGHLGDFDNVANVQAESCFVVRVGDAGLLHAGVSRKFTLENEQT